MNIYSHNMTMADRLIWDKLCGGLRQIGEREDRHHVAARVCFDSRDDARKAHNTIACCLKGDYSVARVMMNMIHDGDCVPMLQHMR